MELNVNNQIINYMKLGNVDYISITDSQMKILSTNDMEYLETNDNK